MSTIATLTIEMAANIARLQTDMDQAKRVVNDSMKSIEQAVGMAKTAFVAFAGISSVDAFVGMVRGSIEAAAKLHDLAAQTGATVEALSAMGAVGKTSDTSLETISAAMNKLAKNMAGATEDTKGAGKALEAIGIDFATFKALSPDEQMQAVAKAMDNFADGSGKSAVAMALYGKEGAKLIPFLKDLAEVGELHAKVTADQAAMADNFSDNLVKLQASGEGWKKELTMGMLPALNEAGQAVLDVMNGTGGLREAVRELSRDGTIAEWTRTGITALTYLIDVIEALWRVIQRLYLETKADFEQMGALFTGVGKAFSLAANGDFMGAMGAMAAGMDKAKEVAVKAHDDIETAWQKQLLGESIRTRMAEIQGLGTASEVAKPKLDFTNVMNNNKEAADKQAKAYTDLVASINEKIAAAKLETEVGGKLTEAQKLQLEIDKQVEKGTISLKDATSDNTRALLAQLTAAEQAKAVQEDLRKASEEAWKEYLKNTDALQKNVQAIEDKVRKQLEENDAIGKTKAELLQLEIARLKDEAATLSQIVQQEEYLGLCTRETVAHQDTLSALQKLIEAKEQGVHLQAAKEAADAWEKTAKTIETSLTDALMRGFESGKSFGQNLRDTLYNLFNTLILRPIIQPIAQGASSAVLGAVGMGASGAAAAATPGSLASLVGGATGFLGGGLKAGISGIFGEAGVSGTMDAGIIALQSGNISGGLGTLAGGAAGILGTAAAGIGLGSLIAGDKSVGGLNGAASSAIGTAIGAAIAGPIGAVLGGALGGVFNAAFGMGDKETTSKGVTGTIGGGAVTGQLYANWKQDGGWFRSDKSGVDYTALTADLKSAMDSGALAILESTKVYADALGIPAQQLATITTSFTTQLTGDAEKDKQAILDALGQYQSALTARFQDALTPFQKAGETLIQTMQRLTLIQTVSESLNSLGGAFGVFAHASVDARESIIGLTGGIDALIQKANGFVSNYYTQNEQGGLTAKAVEQGLQAAGFTAEQISALSSRDDYRALLEGLDVNTATGQQQFAALLNLQDKFAAVSTLMSDQKLTLDELAKQAPTVAALDKLFTPTQSTAQATQNVADGVTTSNALLGQIATKLDAISAASDAAVAAANSAAAAAADAAGAASSAASAASSAASSASLAAAAPTYSYDIGGGGG